MTGATSVGRRATSGTVDLASVSQLELVQRAVAELCMDDAAFQTWKDDPDAYAKNAGLTGRNAKQIAGLSPVDVGYYASRRWVDRWSFLQGDLPQTVALAREHGCLYDYFRAVAYPSEDNVEEAGRFAAWLAAAAKRGDDVPCVLPDLSAYEVAVARAWMDEPSTAAPPSPAKLAHPRSTRPRLARGVRLLELAHDITDSIGLDAALNAVDAPHAPTYIGLRRRVRDVEPFGMEEHDYRLLRAANGKRTDAQLIAFVEPHAGASSATLRASLRELREAGLLV